MLFRASLLIFRIKRVKYGFSKKTIWKEITCKNVNVQESSAHLDIQNTCRSIVYLLECCWCLYVVCQCARTVDVHFDIMRYRFSMSPLFKQVPVFDTHHSCPYDFFFDYVYRSTECKTLDFTRLTH